jgi:hypothetical protein
VKEWNLGIPVCGQPFHWPNNGGVSTYCKRTQWDSDRRSPIRLVLLHADEGESAACKRVQSICIADSLITGPRDASWCGSVPEIIKHTCDLWIGSPPITSSKVKRTNKVTLDPRRVDVFWDP